MILKNILFLINEKQKERKKKVLGGLVYRDNIFLKSEI